MLGTLFFVLITVFSWGVVFTMLTGHYEQGWTSRESRLHTKRKSFWVGLAALSVAYVAFAYLFFWVWRPDDSGSSLEWLLAPGLVVAIIWFGELIALWIRVHVDEKTDGPEERLDA